MLFLQGGASLQFSMVPMNLLAAGQTADYIVTGDWSKKALKEAKRGGATHVAASTESGNFRRIPRQDEIKLTPGAAYVHMTSNNTIFGTEWAHVPDVGGAPLVCDASSDIFSRPIDVSKFGLIYAGAQKNLGPVGRDRGHHPRGSARALGRVARADAELQDAGGERRRSTTRRRCSASTSCGLVLKWLVGLGGLSAIGDINDRKAKSAVRRAGPHAVLAPARRPRTAVRR